MALSKLMTRSRGWPNWEVDGSGIEVCQLAGGGWSVEPSSAVRESEARDYLNRHPELAQIYSSRARMVDAVRMILAADPRLKKSPQTRWRKLGKGKYVSADARWQLSLTEREYTLTPLRPLTPAEEDRLIEAFSLWRVRPNPINTLKAIAIETDALNRLLGW